MHCFRQKNWSVLMGFDPGLCLIRLMFDPAAGASILMLSGVNFLESSSRIVKT